MNKRWCLLKASDGQRGINGKQKMYEIVIEDNVVTFSWGMAEIKRRQTKRLVCRSYQHALGEAYAKIDAKVSGGYRIAFAA